MILSECHESPSSGLINDPDPNLKQYGPRMSDNPPCSLSPALKLPTGNWTPSARFPGIVYPAPRTADLFTLHEPQLFFDYIWEWNTAALLNNVM